MRAELTTIANSRSRRGSARKNSKRRSEKETKKKICYNIVPQKCLGISRGVMNNRKQATTTEVVIRRGCRQLLPIRQMAARSHHSSLGKVAFDKKRGTSHECIASAFGRSVCERESRSTCPSSGIATGGTSVNFSKLAT